MGISSDGILVYGIQLKEEFFDDSFSDDEDIENEDAGGLSGAKLLSWMQYHNKPVDDIILVTHCSYDYPMYILGINETECTAWRGSPVKIKSLSIDPEWDIKIKSFIKKYKIKTTKSIGWWLCSIYG